MKLYQDGVDVTGTVTNSTFTNTSQEGYIGNNDFSSEWLSSGTQLSELALYPTALSPERVLAHYETAVADPDFAPVLIDDFDRADGDILDDLTSDGGVGKYTSAFFGVDYTRIVSNQHSANASSSGTGWVIEGYVVGQDMQIAGTRGSAEAFAGRKQQFFVRLPEGDYPLSFATLSLYELRNSYNDGAVQFAVLRSVLGTDTDLGAPDTGDVDATCAVGDEFGWDVREEGGGTRITAYTNVGNGWVERCSWLDTDGSRPVNAGYIGGDLAGDADVTFDNLKVATVGDTLQFAIATGNDDAVVGVDGDATYPGTANSIVNTDTKIRVEKADYGATFTVRSGLLRWDTSSIPDDATIEAAILRIAHDNENDSANARSITAEWYAFDGSAALGDWTSTVGTDAHAGRTIASLISNTDQDFLLLDADANVNKSGYTGLRLHVSGGEPTLINYYDFASIEHASLEPARLIVYYVIEDEGVVIPAIFMPVRRRGR